MPTESTQPLNVQEAALAFLNGDFEFAILPDGKLGQLRKITQISFKSDGRIVFESGPILATCDRDATINVALVGAAFDRNRSALIRTACRLTGSPDRAGNPADLSTTDLIEYINDGVSDLIENANALQRQLDDDRRDMEAVGRVLARVFPKGGDQR